MTTHLLAAGSGNAGVQVPMVVAAVLIGATALFMLVRPEAFLRMRARMSFFRFRERDEQGPFAAELVNARLMGGLFVIVAVAFFVIAL
jgi:hypothetical protein